MNYKPTSYWVPPWPWKPQDLNVKPQSFCEGDGLAEPISSLTKVPGLLNQQFANLKMAIEIVDLPMSKHGDFPVRYVKVYQRIVACRLAVDVLQKTVNSFHITRTGWWLGHPSEKYEFVNWDD